MHTSLAIFVWTLSDAIGVILLSVFAAAFFILWVSEQIAKRKRRK